MSHSLIAYRKFLFSILNHDIVENSKNTEIKVLHFQSVIISDSQENELYDILYYFIVFVETLVN
jgi:hypothetical protein